MACKIAADVHGVRHRQTNLFVRVYDEDRPHRSCFALAWVKHVVKLSDFQISIRNDRETQSCVLRIVNVFDPFDMLAHFVRGQADWPHTA